jgi:diguanylate cyclase (GGDEF)-like protein/PAS domain S-box-containing protein
VTRSRKAESEPEPQHERIAGDADTGGRLVGALRDAQGHLEEDTRAWIADLTAASTTLRRGIGTRKNKSLTEALARLERLEAALRHAPEQIVEHVGRRTAILTSAAMAQLRRIDQLEMAETSLASTNEDLRKELLDRERIAGGAPEEGLGPREVRERFESAFDNAPIGMALIATDDRWLQVNHALCRITGHTEDALKATTLRAMTHPDDVDLDAQSLRQLMAGQIPNYQVEKRFRHAWGHHVWVLVTASIVRSADRTPLYILTQVQDISERKALARRLEYFVDHDFLTGLFNRRHFEQELAKETDRVARYGAPGALIVIDLDNFKNINDTFGHKTGDDVLKGVAGLLRERLRQTDVVARIGGDEFAVLLPQTDADHAQRVADELVKALGRQTAVLADESIRITASIGVTMFDGLTDIEMLAYADLAMYEAKEAGRNRFAMYHPVAGTKGRRSVRLAEAERIREALEADRLILHCQPILDLGTNEICQYELLLRLPVDGSREPLPPSAFLYAAERSGLIQAIDGWVVRKAIALIAEHGRAGLKLVLNVNLSGKSIGDRKLAAFIEKALAEAQIDPAQLNFELTETAAIANIEEAKAFASRLRGLGCQISLDDFGAGLSSFSYLKNLPFDYLKIDGDFIRGLTGSPVDQLVVESIVRIARGMGKKTVAEFVADDETTDLLRTIGVDCAQGYHIGMPRPVSGLLQAGGLALS